MQRPRDIEERGGKERQDGQLLGCHIACPFFFSCLPLSPSCAVCMFNFPARERGASPSALSVNTKQRGAETLLNSLRAPIGLMCLGSQCTNEHLRGLPQVAFTSGRSLDWTDNDVYHGIYYIVPSGYCPTRKRETTAFVRQSALTHKLSQRGLAQERAHELVRALLQGPPRLLGPTPGTELQCARSRCACPAHALATRQDKTRLRPGNRHVTVTTRPGSERMIASTILGLCLSLPCVFDGLLLPGLS